MPKACVVGAGISGVSTALFLKQQGYDVVVVEQRGGPGEGATSIAPGLVPQVAQSYAHYNILNTIKGGFCPWTAYSGENDERNRYSWRDIRNAFGWDFVRSCLPWHVSVANQQLSQLAHANYGLVRDLISTYKLDVPFNFGLLRIFTARSGMLQADEWHDIAKQQVENYDGMSLDAADVHRMLPASQNPTMVALGGYLSPSTMVLDPKRLTTELARVCAERNVEFRFGTQVTALLTSDVPAVKSTNAATSTVVVDASASAAKKPAVHVTGVMTSSGPIHADAVILCSGLSSHTLTDAGAAGGAAVPIVPIKSVGLEVVDTTPNNGRLPALFPGRPAPAFIPPVGSCDTSDATEPFAVVPKPMPANARNAVIPSPYFASTDNPTALAGENAIARADQAALRRRVQETDLFPAAVEFARNNTLLFMPPAPATTALPPPDLSRAEPALQEASVRFDANDVLVLNDRSDVLSARSPAVLEALTGAFGPLRRFRAVVGQDMSEINPELPTRHMDALVKTLDIVKRVTRSAHRYVLESTNLHKAADATLTQERRLELCAPTIGLHTTSRDGLPVTGRVRDFANLYVNTAHGPSPLQTAVAGAQLTASAVAADVGLVQDAVAGSGALAVALVRPAVAVDPAPFAADRFDRRVQIMSMFTD